MEKRNFDVISPDATADQVDAIMRRRAAGNVGTLCVTGDLRDRVNDFKWGQRFVLIRKLLRSIRNFGN